MTPDTRLAERLAAWRVVPTGETWRTPSSLLAAGVLDGRPVVAKLGLVEEERRGGRLMAWWSRHGGLPVPALEDDVLLMARAGGGGDLAARARTGDDRGATEVLARTASALHAMPAPPPELGLLPLRTWFRGLLDASQADPLVRRCAAVARTVLEETTADDVVALHGDLHHGNVLDTGPGWAAIDPKALVGHRAFDLANVLCNPDEPTALRHLDARLPLLAELAGLEVHLLRDWAVAWCGLSLSWGTGEEPGWHDRTARAVAERLLAGLRVRGR